MNYKTDNRRSEAAKPGTYNLRDDCQSPPYAIQPLLPHLPKNARLWEPARGDGYLAQALIDAGYDVVTSCLQTGEDFFKYEPAKWDILVTNPPL